MGTLTKFLSDSGWYDFLNYWDSPEGIGRIDDFALKFLLPIVIIVFIARSLIKNHDEGPDNRRKDEDKPSD